MQHTPTRVKTDVAMLLFIELKIPGSILKLLHVFGVKFSNGSRELTGYSTAEINFHLHPK